MIDEHQAFLLDPSLCGPIYILIGPTCVLMGTHLYPPGNQIISLWGPNLDHLYPRGDLFVSLWGLTYILCWPHLYPLDDLFISSLEPLYIFIETYICIYILIRTYLYLHWDLFISSWELIYILIGTCLFPHWNSYNHIDAYGASSPGVW